MALTPEGTPYVESTDLVANYPAASLSLANRVDLVGILPFADAAARNAAITSPTDGQFTYLQDTNSTQFYNGTAFESFGGKFLQVVRVTDSSTRSTNSLTFVDASISVTITPQRSSSAVLLIWSACLQPPDNNRMRMRIADSSNNAISGVQDTFIGAQNATGQLQLFTGIAYATPATTSAVTYKGRFRMDTGGTGDIQNTVSTGQLYAIEVAA